MIVASHGRSVTLRARQRAQIALLTASVSCSGLLTLPAAQAASDGKDARRDDLEVVVVTAQKVQERLQDVPVPVTPISGDVLVNSNQLRLQDYYNKMPGLSLVSNSFGPSISIRGVTTGQGGGNPTVGIVVDDVPFGASTSLAGGFSVPDIDPSDLQRIEVLRGPQGTLYGASSIGGLLKFVTVEPSTEGVNSRIQVGMSSVANGDSTGYSARGAVNVPLGETWAVRASGFTRRDPGYIDNPGLGLKDVNETDVDGGRLSALWRPSDDFSLKLSALLQNIDAQSWPFVNPSLGELRHSAVRNTGWADKTFEAYSATITASFGEVSLVSISGYAIDDNHNSSDVSFSFGPASLVQFGVAGAPLENRNRTEKFTQEVRLTGALSEHVDWLLGGFYTDEDTSFVQTIYAADPATGVIAGKWVDFVYPTTYEEYAAFADLTFRLTDTFDVQVGGRGTKIRQEYSETDTGIYTEVFLGLPSPVINPLVKTNDDAFTYLVTPRWKITPDTMLYARAASGYRAGGPNPQSTVFGVSPHFKPDETQNYEIGMKGDLLNGVLSYDTSVYYIDWKDIQLTVIDPATFTAYLVNGSRARSEGFELSLRARPLEGLTIAAWAAWNDAVLTENLPPGGPGTPVGASGDRLPNSSRFAGNFSIEEEFALTGRMTGFVGGSMTYVGERMGVFRGRSAGVRLPRQTLPSYKQTDLHAGVKLDSWTLSLFVNNVSDERGILSYPRASTINTVIYIPPRTAGLSLTKVF